MLLFFSNKNIFLFYLYIITQQGFIDKYQKFQLFN